MRTVTITNFKAHCLQLIEEVKTSGEGVLVTKRGKPAVRVLPPEEQDAPMFQIGRFNGSIKIVGDIISPLDVEWEAMK